MSASLASRPLRAEVYLSTAQLAAASSLRPEQLARLIRAGLIEPRAPGTGEFTLSTAARLRRMLRLRRDLHVNLAGAAVIVDLVERLDQQEIELGRLRRAASA